MVGDVAGAIGMSIGLNDSEFLNQIDALGRQAADRLRTAFSDITFGGNAFKGMESIIRDATRAIDVMNDNITNSLSNIEKNLAGAVENGLSEGAKIGSQRMASQVKFPQLKAEYIASDYENAIARTAQQLDTLNAKIYELQSAGGENKALYKMMEQSDQLVVKIRTLEEALAKTKAGASGIKEAGANLSNSLKDAGASGTKAGQDIDKSMKMAEVSVGDVGNEIVKTSSKFKSLARLAGYAFGIRSVFMLVRRAVQDLKESINDVSRQFPKFGAQVNLLRQQSQQLRSAFGAMFLPLYKVAMPILSAVYNFAIKVFNGIAMVMAKLFGQKTAFQAVGGITAADVEAASAIDKSAAASKKDAKAKAKQKKKAEELKAVLAGFDELNIIDFNKKEDGEAADGLEDGLGSIGGAGGGLTQGGLFEEVSVGRSIWKDLFDLIKDTKPWGILEKSAKKAFKVISEHAEKAYQRISKSWDENSVRMADALKHVGPKMAEAFAGMAGYVFIPLKAGAVAAAIDIGAAFIDGFITLGADLMELFDAVFSPIFDAINGFFDRHGEEISALIYETWTMIGEGLSGILDGVVEIFHQVFGGLIDWFREHGKEIEKLLSDTWETVWGIVQPIWNEMLSIGKAIFGALRDFLFEMAPKVRDVIVNTWNLIWQIVRPLWEEILRIAQVIFGKLQTFWQNWGGAIKTFFSGMWKAITTLFGTALDAMALLIKAVSQIIQGDWEGLWNTVKELAVTIWNGLVTTLDNVIHSLSGLFDKLYLDIDRIWENIKGVFQGVIDFIAGIFTGDWERAWNGVIGIFSSIWDGMKAIFVAPINWIIDGLNFFIRQLNKIKIPDWVHGVGGRGINISEIEHIQLARGGIVDQPTIAEIGERGAEAVVPLENNTGWMDKLAEALASKMGGKEVGDEGVTNVTIPVYLSDGNLLDVIEVAFDRRGRLRNEPIFG